MNTTLAERVAALEEQVSLLAAEVARGQAPTAAPERQLRFARPELRPAPEPAAPKRPARAYVPSRQRVQLEEAVGGRLLALVGGVAIVLAIAFFFALAIDSGWIGETARVLIAAGGSSALFAAAIWLYERKGRTQAALAMVGTAIAGLFLTLVAASVLYELFPEAVALVLAFGIGALATAIAIRWETRTVACLGIGGTLLAPVLGGALTTAAMGFLVIAGASAAGVLVWRRWAWLAVGASALTLSQVVVWAIGEPPRVQLVVVLGVVAALNVVTALAYQLRQPAATLEPASALLVPFGALILGATGYYGLPHGEGDLAGGIWLAGLGVAHAALGGAALRMRRASEEIGLVLLGASLLLGDAAFGLLADGWVLGVGWAASAAGIAALARRGTGRTELIHLTLGGQLALAVGHVLLFDAPPTHLGAETAVGHGPIGGLSAVAVCAFASARLVVDQRQGAARVALDALAMASLAYVTAVSLDGAPLLIAWAGASIALARTARRLNDRVARLGAFAFLALLAGHVLAFEVPPSALVYGVGGLVDAALGLGLVAGVAAFCARTDPTGSEGERAALDAFAAAALVYLGSAAIVTPFQPGEGAIDTGLGVGIRQQGQVLLSAFWSACGFAALWFGLRREARLVRLGGLGLLGIAVVKVFLYDLSTLASIYRVASLVALGLLLLTAAFAYQRMRAVS